MQTVAIVGVGLIGGSFGLALRKAGFTGEVIGVSSPAAINAGLRTGAISRAATLEEAAACADCFYLAQPVDRILTTIAALGPLLRSNCLVTDAGSTKAQIVRQATTHLPHAEFVGGHPMAGKEQRGVEVAEADLFRDRPYVLTSSLTTSRAIEFRSWLERIGAKVITMSADEHDRAVAFSSHLPQLVSTALAKTLAAHRDERIAEVAGPGLIDMTRLALSSADLWQSILETNREQVSASIDELVQSLLELKSAIGTSVLEPSFAAACNFALSIRNSRSKR